MKCEECNALYLVSYRYDVILNQYEKGKQVLTLNYQRWLSRHESNGCNRKQHPCDTRRLIMSVLLVSVKGLTAVFPWILISLRCKYEPSIWVSIHDITYFLTCLFNSWTSAYFSLEGIEEKNEEMSGGTHGVTERTQVKKCIEHRTCKTMGQNGSLIFRNHWSLLQRM